MCSFYDQVSDAEQLTVRHRIPKLPAVRQQSLADVAVDLASKTQRHPHGDFKRILSEPLFNHLREKLHKIRRKRASSDPVSLDAIRQRKLSLQNTVSFQIGQEEAKKTGLKKVYSLDSTMQTDGTAVMPQRRTELSLSQSEQHISEQDEVTVRKTSSEAELLSAQPPPEEREERDDCHSTVGK